MMRARRVAMAWLLAVLGTAGTLAQAAEVGDTIRLPDVKLLDGRTVPASQWAGKPVVIEFWASWCPFCALQNPRVQALYDKTRGTKLQVLTISIDKQPQEAVAYLKQRGYTFPARRWIPMHCAVPLAPARACPSYMCSMARGVSCRRRSAK
jgi:thiol-disulfide isomerase/thioredoxin